MLVYFLTGKLQHGSGRKREVEEANWEGEEKTQDGDGHHEAIPCWEQVARICTETALSGGFRYQK